MRPDLSPTDTLHLAALRGAIARAQYLAVKGARRSEVCATFMEGAYVMIAKSDFLSSEDCVTLAIAVNCIHERGYREVLTQLHILEGQK